MPEDPAPPSEPVVIVGAGLAGLSCAKQLAGHGIPCVVLEADSEVGGRVRTDSVDGFLLDRGFQVLLTSYPEAQKQLDYDALRLGRFEPGALIRYEGKFRRFADPFRRPSKTLATALSPVATLADKLRVARLRYSATAGAASNYADNTEETTRDYLRRLGFSDRVITAFFTPFFGGVFLDGSLATSSRMFECIFGMFATGDATLPADGMQAIPHQLAGALRPGTLRFGVHVTGVGARHVETSEGRIDAAAVVVATDLPSATEWVDEASPREWCGTTCLYFAADRPPIEEPTLVLNGEGKGPVNTLCVPSQVSAKYAPAGAALVSVSSLDMATDEEPLRERVLEQLRGWYGEQVDGWRHLRTYRIPHALPAQPVGSLAPIEKTVTTGAGVFLCGDHRDTASIQGAMVSGRRAAEAVAASVA
ncbi:MAG: NAD(P)/FAD-dependent oxidoreductase [Planctomycetota bacterium]